MDKEKLLQLIHCKLKNQEASFYNLTVDVGLAYMIKEEMIISVGSKVLYKSIFNFFFPRKNVPYKTKYIMDVRLFKENALSKFYTKYQSFELSLEEFNEINDLMKSREKERIERIITKELQNCR